MQATTGSTNNDVIDVLECLEVGEIAKIAGHLSPSPEKWRLTQIHTWMAISSGRHITCLCSTCQYGTCQHGNGMAMA